MSRPLVSIIIPNYNKAPYIRESIESALNQTYKNIEVIVVDDGSTDKSRKIIKSFGKKIKAYFLPHKNANVARNFGFKKSKGEYIQFLDSDDIILPEKIEKQVELLEKTGADMALCYCEWHPAITHNKGFFIPLPNKLKNREYFRWLLKDGNPCMAPLYRRKLLWNKIKWDESLQLGQDIDFHFRVALEEPEVAVIKETLCTYRLVERESKRCPEYVILWAKDTLKAHKKLIPYLKNSVEKCLLARRIYKIARTIYDFEPEVYEEAARIALSLCPDFEPNESLFFRLTYKFLGRRLTEKLAYLKRRVKRWVKPIKF